MPEAAKPDSSSLPSDVLTTQKKGIEQGTVERFAYLSFLSVSKLLLYWCIAL